MKQDRWSEGVEYLNPDDVAQERFGNSARREELLSSGRGIAFETVFSRNEKVD